MLVFLLKHIPALEDGIDLVCESFHDVRRRQAAFYGLQHRSGNLLEGRAGSILSDSLQRTVYGVVNEGRGAKILDSVPICFFHLFLN